eukprot:8864030-Pyramimonas_sp.AAC.1
MGPEWGAHEGGVARTKFAHEKARVNIAHVLQAWRIWARCQSLRHEWDRRRQHKWNRGMQWRRRLPGRAGRRMRGYPGVYQDLRGLGRGSVATSVKMATSQHAAPGTLTRPPRVKEGQEARGGPAQMQGRPLPGLGCYNLGVGEAAGV